MDYGALSNEHYALSICANSIVFFAKSNDFTSCRLFFFEIFGRFGKNA